MIAARIHRFGPPGVIQIEEVDRPTPSSGEVLVRVRAAGVGPWDGWIRAGHSALQQTLPLILGSDLSGTVEVVGADVTGLSSGDEVFGVTNPYFIGAYADFALAKAGMLTARPRSLTFVEAASVPVVAVTASQMLFKHARLQPGQRVLIHGAAGSVGAYAVQLARLHDVSIVATAGKKNWDDVRGFGADQVADLRENSLSSLHGQMDAVVDLVGGDSQALLWPLLKRGGTLVSAVSQPDPDVARRSGVNALFFLVDVTSAELNTIAQLFDAGRLKARVGTTLDLQEARRAHEMLEGSGGRPTGKMVLRVAIE
jgi:NADPH:quinone reductase-like Zn-dependent oxidoreductase